jgi:hypothetical protein
MSFDTAARVIPETSPIMKHVMLSIGVFLRDGFRDPGGTDTRYPEFFPVPQLCTAYEQRRGENASPPFRDVLDYLDHALPVSAVCKIPLPALPAGGSSCASCVECKPNAVMIATAMIPAAIFSPIRYCVLHVPVALVALPMIVLG